jgi:hypothetical protein
MKDLPRWLFSSLASYFEGVASDNSIPYFVEGIDERSSEFMQASHAEMRVTGPYTKEISNGIYDVEVVANVLLTSFMDMDGPAYELIQWCGVFQEAMLDPVPVYKYGPNVQDTQELIGCLRVKNNKGSKVKVFHFGQMNTTDRFRQSEVDVLFDMHIDADLI